MRSSSPFTAPPGPGHIQVLRVIDSHAPPASSPPPAAGIASSEWMHAGASAATALERECECVTGRATSHATRCNLRLGLRLEEAARGCSRRSSPFATTTPRTSYNIKFDGSRVRPRGRRLRFVPRALGEWVFYQLQDQPRQAGVERRQTHADKKAAADARCRRNHAADDFTGMTNKGVPVGYSSRVCNPRWRCLQDRPWGGAGKLAITTITGMAIYLDFGPCDTRHREGQAEYPGQGDIAPDQHLVPAGKQLEDARTLGGCSILLELTLPRGCSRGCGTTQAPCGLLEQLDQATASVARAAEMAAGEEAAARQGEAVAERAEADAAAAKLRR
jgi:hypothetical protein